ncbi:glycosyltransferase family 4 protein [Enterococcus raffinosus]|uniref:Glycosyltransferase family 4 protein n=1 Tax=Enterococcus raffinosus TaxID=71452 RepID=A0AAW8T915_9ENTE|nr:glycosyltransferase family 4 protein [Enterococcus raffinosus]MDT2522023.1 glycosyltransferase family 4 protein [Enterococcus raffinosus]MDT2528367.1 glycosyltransferase family 4 protein [Enterococcus raffinosus]MDT2533167.1 glycosyltransferase family 4 protein [Enterococcus raffinosus]MDT2543607.1 glycosyltransferase family 4 protein [Enterococcus raffinosus]MDT2553721.1 glycosyltransferase family 4 protein [Enterococcus raffinosus]
MKKALLLSNHAKYTYRLRKELIYELLDQGYSVALICPYGKELDIFKARGVQVYDIPFDSHGRNLIQELLLFFRLFYLIFSMRPDIILGYTIKFNIYGNLVARMLNIPFIANITGLGEGFSRDGVLRTMLLAMYRFSFKKVAHIFFQNEKNRCFFKENHLLNGSNSVLPGSGISFEDFPLQPFVEQEVTNILFLSRVTKNKGINEFLAVAERFVSSKRNIRFHVAGTLSSDYEEIIHSYVRSDIIDYHGEIEAVADFMKEMDIIISPSYHEGMSNTLLEAAAIGRPIITSDIAGCKEIVLDGISGRVVPVKKIDALSEALEELLELSKVELEKMGYEGRKFIEKKFDRKFVIKEYLKAIDKILQIESDHKEDSNEGISAKA